MNAFLPVIPAFAAFLAAIVVGPRLVSVKAPAVFVCAAGAAVYAAFLAVIVATGNTILFWPVSALYWFLFLVFLVIFLVVYRSASLRIMGELLDRPGHAESYESLFERYLRLESLNSRLGLLVETSYARDTGSGFELTEKGKKRGRLVAALQKLFNIEFGG